MIPAFQLELLPYFVFWVSFPFPFSCVILATVSSSACEIWQEELIFSQQKLS